ncbi:ABC transporter permease [Bifidobacterium goeldii]|uniref:ABC transporter permease n=1 Tax=Bifidobacterium goeldii TaxID=2306975 RepID=A0A430FEW8_9BIFI|nr:ABC transporter permease [Bifidobacterium goeldii]RSX51403.1 ABC transporter permease [Bifidobacterium goeldii]
MFVLKNAWAAIARRKWRALLTALIAIVVTFGTMFGMAVLQENDTATGSAYNSQKVTALIRPNAKTQAKYNGADSSYTENYLGWTGYTTYATAVQSAGVTFGYTFAETVPVRQTEKFQAIAGTDDQDADKTGGELQFRAFYSLDAAHDNDYGRYKVVEGKHLNYSGQDENSVLISKALAKKNKLSVGDTFEIAYPNDASKTVKLKVRGIYEYTEAAAKGKGSDAKLAKDNRDNAIYSAYYAFGMAGFDAVDGTGWLIPDLNIAFQLNSVKDYQKFVKALKKAKLPAKYEVSSPSLAAYEESIATLGSLAATLRPALIALWVIGGLLLLVLLGFNLHGRANEIGTQLMIGVTKGRIAWQFMLEVFMPTLLGFVIGALAGGFGSKSLGAALAGGHATAPTSALVWHVIWGGLGVIIVLMLIAMIRVLAFRSRNLFAARSGSSESESAASVTETTEA